MMICTNHHDTICYEGEGYTCPLCSEMEDNRLLRGEIHELKEEVKDTIIKLKAIRNYINNELSEKEECLCKVSTE